MNWKDLGSIVGKAAPLVGGLLGGPAGATVGGLVASLLGTDSDPKAIEKAIQADPEALLKIKQMEMDDNKQLRELQYRTLVTELHDTQHARTAHKDHWMPWVLTVILSIMVAATTAGLMMLTIPESSQEVLFFLAGQVVNAFLTAIAYWLGTSRSSHDKTKHMATKYERS